MMTIMISGRSKLKIYGTVITTQKRRHNRHAKVSVDHFNKASIEVIAQCNTDAMVVVNTTTATACPTTSVMVIPDITSKYA